MSQHALRRPRRAFAAAVTALALGLGISVVAVAPANAGGSDSPVPYTVTSTTLTLPHPDNFSPNQEVNYRVTKLDGTGARQFGVGNNIPHNGVWPRAIYIGHRVYTWTDHPDFASYFPTGTGYCITWVQVGQYNEHFGEGGQAPVCWRPSIPDVKDASASVSVSAPSCAAPGAPTFTIANATWTSTRPTAAGGPYTATATATSGHVFADGAATKAITYSVPSALDASGSACLRPVPVKPAFTAITECATHGSIDFGAANAASTVTHVAYTLTSGTGVSGLNTVTATAIDGYTLLADAVATWTIDLGAYTECVEPAASYSVGECWSDESKDSFRDLTITFDNSDSTTSVLFAVIGSTVTRTVAAGSTDSATIAVPTSGSTAYSVLGAGEELLEIPAIAAFDGCVDEWLDGDPISTDAVCSPEGGVVNGSIWVLRMEGLQYVITEVTEEPVLIATLPGDGNGTVSVAPGYYEVTVSALPGYNLNPATAGPWWYTVAGPQLPCDLTTEAAWPTNATVTAERCSPSGTTPGTITVGLVDGVSYFDEVNYFLDGSATPMTAATVAVAAGTHTVTAAPKVAGDGLQGLSSWTLAIPAATASCELTTLALTGATAAPWFAIALLAVFAGLAVLIIAFARRRLANA